MLDDRARRMRRVWGVVRALTAFGIGTTFAPASARVHARAVAAVSAAPTTIALATIDATVRASTAIPVVPHASRASVEPMWLTGDGTTPDVFVYPPRSADAARAPVAVMLHGMCGAPESTCPWFAASVAERSWLVCPRGTSRCDGGGTAWSWKDNASFVRASVKRVADAFPAEVDDAANGTLIGFSWGALAALDVAQHGDGRWSRLVLISADVRPDAALLARAGVRRVYMGAGDADMMHGPMSAASLRLGERGVPSTFASLGNVGHTFPRDMERWVARAVTWTNGDDDAL